MKNLAQQGTVRTITVISGLVVFLWLGSVLPRTANVVFASPDETAVFQFARHWSPVQGFRIPHGLSEASSDIASLHPRSMVRQGRWLVPVGFLGMPLMSVVFERVWSGSSLFFTLLLVVSSAYALWKLAERYSPRVALVTVALYLSFPTVLLYVNRGFFPNLPVVALGLWAVWGVQKKEAWSLVISGLCLGLALIIRPIEALWLIPWVVWAFVTDAKQKYELKQIGVVSVMTLIVCIIGALLAYQTYGKLTTGYWLRDDAGAAAMAVPTSLSVPGSQSVLPFGIHPRALWHNINLHLFGLFGPWVAAAACGVALSLQRGWKREGFVFAGVAMWTTGVLFLLYGQSLYADNIRGTVAIGNSFPRYLIPLVPFVAFSAALLVDRLMMIKRRGRIVAYACVLFLCALGVSTALTKDEEGVLQTAYELKRYQEIQTAVAHLLPEGSIIISERSDKIFAGLPLVAVSPMPDRATIERLVQSDRVVALFHRTILLPENAPKGVVEFLDPFFTPAVSVDNESLYLLNADLEVVHDHE